MTILSAYNYAGALGEVQRYAEAETLLRKMIPVARRVLGESNDTKLRMLWLYAQTIYKDDGATLDDVRKAVTTLEEAARTARRVLGAAHPVTKGIERDLRIARAVLRAREKSA